MSNEQLAISNGKEDILLQLLDFCCLIVAFVVFVIDKSKRRISLQSFIMLLYSIVVSRLVSLSRSSQYSVSAASFREIAAFTRNSFLLTAYCASVKFAPIDWLPFGSRIERKDLLAAIQPPSNEPDRNSCLASVNSCLSSHRNLYKLYILIANFRLFSKTIFFAINTNIKKINKRGKKINE